jgi:phage host-nuclease inhibitor protein Gam
MKKKKSNRLKLTTAQTPVIQTRAEMESLVREVAELTLTRNKQQTELDLAITCLRNGYDKIFGAIDEQLAEKTAAARAWADANPAEFKGLKSLELTHGTVGFRTGQPTLKTLRGWTWKRVLEVLLLLPKLPAEYIRRSPEVNKEAILADRKRLTDEGLRALGLEVIQTESFFIDPKIETPENRQTLKQAA